jgi:murein endopeptidase
MLLLVIAWDAERGRDVEGAHGQATEGETKIEQVDPGQFQWRGSVSVGRPWDGALLRGVQLPAEGADFFTWDFPLRRSPNRDWRRWGADRMVNRILSVIAEYRLAHPLAPRVGIADLSRPHGGPFGKRFGGLGHASHQNGTDVDVLYPRRDALELAPGKPAQIDRALAQDLVDRFVAAGAKYVFVGPGTGLGGPRRVVKELVHHDDHIHVRFFDRGRPLD